LLEASTNSKFAFSKERMEHLPPAVDPYSPVLVPYIGESEYDNLDFAGYPRRSKIDIDLLLVGDFQGFSSRRLAAFLQTWLFFGLMHEILSMDIQTKEFIRTNKSGQIWITTEKLPGYLQAFRRQVLEIKAGPNGLEISRRRLEQMHKSFVLSCTTFQGFETFENRHGVPNLIPPEVGLGIHVLAITLEVATTEICAEKYRDTPWAKERTWVNINNSFLRDRMVGQGWCPSVVEQLRGNALNQYYASLLGPSKRGLNHGLCSRENSKCIATTTVVDGYVIRHQKEGCQCSILKTDSEVLARVIRSGEIPVLYLDEETGNRRLEVLSATSGQGLEYTAISHVYAIHPFLQLCKLKTLSDGRTAGATLPRTLSPFSVYKSSSASSQQHILCQTLISKQTRASGRGENCLLIPTRYAFGWIRFAFLGALPKYTRKL
jgi:hypothetical protein